MTVDRHLVDLRNQAATKEWLTKTKPDFVFVASGTVGGILANDSRPGEFLYDNLMIAANIIESARTVGVKKLLYLGSACIYPKHTDQSRKKPC